MTQLELKMSALILEACEDLLPKTTARSNKSVIKALEAAREHINKSNSTSDKKEETK
jgi:hypothetical protein